VAFAVTRCDGDSGSRKGSETIPSGSVVRLDPRTGERTSIFVASTPDPFTGGPPPLSYYGLVVGQGGVWILRNVTLFHVDPLHGEVRRRIEVGTSFSFTTNVAEGLEAIWIVSEGGLFRVNPATDEPRLIERFSREVIVSPDVVVGGGYVWVGMGTGRLLRLEPNTGERTWASGLDPIDGIAFGHGGLWTIDSLHGTVTRWDPATMRPLDVIPLSIDVDAIVSGDAHVWVLSRNVGSLAQIDVHRGELAQTARVGNAPIGLAAGLGAVWVGDEDGVIRRVDESTLQVTEVPLEAAAASIAVDEDAEVLWVDVA
jgi:outer membrane protein assembly factor BamB